MIGHFATAMTDKMIIFLFEFFLQSIKTTSVTKMHDFRAVLIFYLLEMHDFFFFFEIIEVTFLDFSNIIEIIKNHQL